MPFSISLNRTQSSREVFFLSHGGLTTYVAVAKCYKIPTIKCRLRTASIHINVLLWHLYRHFIFFSIDKKWWCIFRDLTKSNSILLNVPNMSHSMMVVIHKHRNQFFKFCHANVLQKVFYEWQGYRLCSWSLLLHEVWKLYATFELLRG